MSALHTAIALSLPSLQGWCTPEKATAMADLILAERPRVVVEIGVFGGASLIAQAMALRHVGHGHIYGIDPWLKEANLEGTNDPANDEWWAALDIEAIHRGCAAAIHQHHLDPWCTLIRNRSENVKDLFPIVGFAPSAIDILHLDGNHSAEASTRDVVNYLPRLKPGGYLWFDDVNWATTAPARELVECECKVVKDITTEGQHCRLYRKA